MSKRALVRGRSCAYGETCRDRSTVSQTNRIHQQQIAGLNENHMAEKREADANAITADCNFSVFTWRSIIATGLVYGRTKEGIHGRRSCYRRLHLSMFTFRYCRSSIFQSLVCSMEQAHRRRTPLHQALQCLAQYLSTNRAFCRQPSVQSTADFTVQHFNATKHPQC